MLLDFGLTSDELLPVDVRRYGAKLVADDIDNHCTTRCATGGKIVSVFFCVIMGSVGVGQVTIEVFISSSNFHFVD